MRPGPGTESVILADNHGESFATLQRPGDCNAIEIREMIAVPVSVRTEHAAARLRSPGCRPGKVE
jgi:hypothetical protein